ncbi:MAG: DNA-3-methyladenine glycosylase I [Clostridia bacterium]|nr:DNA-3-methyladenine glycosylase I [Clostridia bacterium]
MAKDTPIINSYCDYINNMPNGLEKDLNKKYHDTQYGFPIHNDNELFGRLILEINQAGLSWITILKKQDNFRAAYDNFDIEKIANYKEEDIARLLSNSGIIRNRLKINAVIYNANVILGLQKEYGSFEKWLEAHHPLTKEKWIKLFKKHFKFVGGEIVGEFLISIGYLKGAHIEDCPIYKQVLAENPKWNCKTL